jgi:uncharacterized protein
MKIEGLFIYPIKSLPGISVHEWIAEYKGLKLDRRMMLIDSENKFVSLRTLPELYHCKLNLSNADLLKVSYALEESWAIDIALNEPELTSELDVVIWNDTVKAGLMKTEIHEWFSDMFKKHLRLVFMKEEHQRQIDKRYANEGESVSFADGYPYLIVQTASLDYLNQLLETPIEMVRFRPNIVISGGATGFEEDSWTQVIAGELKFKLVKPCGRCKVINIDPHALGLNPKIMETLKSFRPSTFGMNACLMEKQGILRVHDEIMVLK